jgi:hypothetical protein
MDHIDDNIVFPMKNEGEFKYKSRILAAKIRSARKQQIDYIAKHVCYCISCCFIGALVAIIVIIIIAFA